MSARSLLALVALLILPLAADAHNIGVECKLKGSRVHVEAFYDDDTPGAHAKIVILDAGQKVVATGKTDDKGEWSFPAPAPGQYEVRVDAGAGHRASKKTQVPAENFAAEPAEEPTISEGPSRVEFTSFPWLKVAIGLGTIGTLCGGYFLASLLRRHAPPA